MSIDPQMHPESPGDRSLSLAAIGLVAGIYVHFLLFAQFGFLQGIRASGHAIEAIHVVLGSMALAGIAMSFLAAAGLRRIDARIVAAAGFACAAAASGTAALAFREPGATRAMLIAISILTGSGLACATVATALLLRRFTAGRSLGLHVGLGTGVAYLFCNVPAVFTATPADKGWISALAALTGLASALVGREHTDTTTREAYPALTTRGAVAFATVGFLALVWFDSAAFAVVQNTPALRDLYWNGPSVLWTIGVVHALTAVGAGLLIDRGDLRTTLAGALALLVLGHLGFGRGEEAGSWAAPVYATGVSLYSTALAAFAALGPSVGTIGPPWRAAWIYAIAGWAGSAAGVGLAEQFGRVPVWAAPTAALLLAGALSQLSSTRTGVSISSTP
jgi:cytochrome c oxidase cbb3-type subunit 2